MKINSSCIPVTAHSFKALSIRLSAASLFLPKQLIFLLENHKKEVSRSRYKHGYLL